MSGRFSPVGDALVLLQHAVVAGHGLGQVGQQRDVHGAQASLLPRGVDPKKETDDKMFGSSSVAKAKAVTVTIETVYSSGVRCKWQVIRSVQLMIRDCTGTDLLSLKEHPWSQSYFLLINNYQGFSFQRVASS